MLNTADKTINNFLQNLINQGKSKVSIKNYKSDITHFLSWITLKLKTLGTYIENASEITPFVSEGIFNEYRSYMVENSLKTKTTNRRLSTLRNFSKFLYSEGLVDGDFMQGIQNVGIGSEKTLPKNGADIVNNFRDSLISQKVSPNTIKNYAADVKSFIDWSGKKSINGLVSNDIKNYREEVLKTSTASTFDRKVSSLKKFFDWAIHEGHVDENPVESFLKEEEKIISTKLGKIEKKNKNKSVSYNSFQARIVAKFAGKPKIQKLAYNLFYTRPKWYQTYHTLPIATYFNYAILVLLMSAVGFGVYNQFFKTTSNPLAYPTSLTRAGRYLSFQGRLTNILGNPITSATNLDFKLYNASTSGTLLWDSGVCSITPDTDGIFSTLLGNSCGSEIESSVFSENASVWLGVTVGGDAEATPRVQIATVAYALNSETLQGYPASSSATANTVPVMNNLGQIVLAASSPKIQSTSGNFGIEGQSVTITTPTSSNGNITLAPDGTGVLNLTFAGAAPGGSANGFVNATNTNITSGALYYGEVASNASGYNLLQLASGSSPTDKFTVDSAGNTMIAGNITSATWTANLISTLYGGTGANNSTAAQYSIPYYSTTGVLGGVLAPGTSGYVLTTNNTGGAPTWTNAASVGTNYWKLGLGTVSPFSDSLDVLFGSSATTSAKFAFKNVLTGTPTASISGSTANVATFIDGDGNISSTNRNDLTFGNSTTYNTTGNILLNPNGTGDVGIGTTPTAKLDVNGNVNISGYATASASLALGNTTAAAGPGHLNMSGDLTVGGTTTLGTRTYTWPGSESAGFLVTNGSGTLGWTTTLPSATTIGFDKITTGTNLSQTLTVGNGSSLTYSGTGTINASTLVNGTWAAPGAIGTTTPAAGNFTTIGVTTQGTGAFTTLSASYATLSASLALGNTTAAAGPGHLNMSGNLTAGGTINGLGVSSGTITSGTWNGTAVGSQYGGTGADNSTAAQYSVPYYSATGVLGGVLTPGTSGYILSTNGAGGAPSWIPMSAAGTNHWQLANNILAPINVTNDLTIGGNATGSAFQVFGVELPGGNVEKITSSGITTGNILSITSTALTTGSALYLANNTANNALLIHAQAGASLTDRMTLDSNGVLTIYDASATDYLRFSHDGTNAYITTNTGNVEIGSGSGDLTLGDALNAVSIYFAHEAAPVSIGGAAGTIINLTQIGNITGAGAVTLAAGGTNTALTLEGQGSGAVNIAGTSTGGVNIAGSGTGDVNIAGGSGSTGCTITNSNGNLACAGTITATGGITATSIPFSGITSATNTTAAMVVGAGASLNYTSTGTINASSLIGNTWVAPGAIGTTTPAAGNFTTIGATTQGTGAFTTLSSSGNTTIGDATTDTLTIWPNTWTLSNSTPNLDLKNSTVNALAFETSLMSFDTTNTRVGIGTTAPTALLDVAGAASVSGSLTFRTGASSIQTTAFNPLTIGGATTGNITLNPSNAITGGYVAPNTTNRSDLGTASLLWRNLYATNLYQGANSVCDSSGANCPYWDQALGALFTENSTTDLLIGSSATSSAKFAFKNVLTGTPTASISGSVANVATFIDGNGNISTTNGANLVLGNSATYASTGNILLNPNGTGNVGIGTTNPLSPLYLSTSFNSDTIGAGTFINTYSGAVDTIGVYGEAMPADYYGYGGVFKGSYIGVLGNGVGTGSDDYTGVKGESVSNNTGINYGGYFYASNGTTNIALNAFATAGANNYAINADGGAKSYFGGDVGIGTTTPGGVLDVSGGMLAIDNGDLGTPRGIRFRETTDTTTPSGAAFYQANNNNLYIQAGSANYINLRNASGANQFTFNTSNSVLGFNTAGGGLKPAAADSTTAIQIKDYSDNVFVNFDSTNQRVGIGTTTPTASLSVAGTATISGTLTVGDGTTNVIQSPYGPLTLNYKSGADAWSAGLTLTNSGYVGIGTTTPAVAMDVNGYVRAQRFEDQTTPASFYVDPAAAGTSVSIEGDIVSNGAFSITSNGTNGNITLNAGTGNVVIGDGATSKLDAGTIDPPYTINGSKYATYVASMTGVKEETTGTVATTEVVPGQGYRAALDFEAAPDGSDLWIFSNVTELPTNLDKLVVLLSPASSTKAWYTFDASGKIYIYTSRPTTVSYRLTAPRFDAENWSNIRGADEVAGFIIPDTNIWPGTGGSTDDNQISFNNLTVNISTESGEKNYALIDSLTNTVVDEVLGLSKAIIANVKAGMIVTEDLLATSFTAFQGTVDNMLIKSGLVATNINTKLISPLADETDITIKVGNATESGKLAIQNGQGQEVASIDSSGDATFSGTLYADKINSKSLDDIKSLLTQVQVDQSLLAEASTWSINSTSSANINQIAAADLYVTNQAAINTLSVTNSLTVGSDMVIASTTDNQIVMNTIDSLSSPLKIQSLAMAPVEIMAGLFKIDTNGNVQITGNLAVNGNIESSSLNLIAKESTESGQLLTLHNQEGNVISSVDSSGSAQFTSVLTQGLTIAGGIDATNSAVIDGVITTNATAGSGIIQAGTSEIKIKNPNVSDYSLVYVTPTSSTENYVLYVKSKAPGEFTVGFTNPIGIDVNFNWWIVQIKN